MLGLLVSKGADLSVQNFHTSEYAQGSWLRKGRRRVYFGHNNHWGKA